MNAQHLCIPYEYCTNKLRICAFTVVYKEISMSNNMPFGWKVYKIKDIVRTNDQTIASDYPYNKILYLDTSSITNGKIHNLQEYKITEAPSRARRIVKNKDIVYSTVRPIQRHYGIINNPQMNLVVSTGFVVIETNLIRADPYFIYCFLTSDETVAYLDVIAEASTSTYPSFRPEDIENLKIILPPLAEQRAIASVLSSLDDKIDLLQRENQTLEQIAETLFRQWFVEEASEDWEEILLKDIYMFDKGFEPGSRNYLEEKEADSIRFIRVGDMLDPKASTYIKKEPGQITCGKKDLLVSFDGTIGRVSFGIEGAYSSGIRKVYSLDPIYNSLGLKYLLFTSREIQDVIKSHSSGTVIAHAGSSIDYLTFRFPKKNRLQEFNQITDPMFFKITKNLNQIETLEKLRNALLPKLISGEVRVI